MSSNSISVAGLNFSDQEREYGLRALLVYTFVMVTGFSMVMPLVAVHFVNNLGMAAALVGSALAVRQLTQQGLTVLGGILSDRFGARRMMCLGVLVRALGFASLAWTNTPLMLFAALIISALGGALFEAPYQVSIVALSTEERRPHYYLVSNLVAGVASTLGPLLGVFLLRFDFQAVCLGAALCFLLNFFIAIFLLPVIAAIHEENKRASGLMMVFNNKPFMLFTGFMIGYWFTSMQINISFPLWAEKLTGSQQSVGVMYALSAAVTVILQYPLVKFMQRYLSADKILIIGIMVMSISSGAIGFVQSFFMFLFCVVIFTIGVLMTRPTQQTIVASLVEAKALGAFLGFSSIGLAVGGGLGNVVGGWLIDIANARQMPVLPWVVFCAVGLASAFGLFRLSQSLPNTKTRVTTS